eukprot:CAMPEP_0113647050 /NCGR_PEP_ID=MMETSP0017_2-20120614/24886_1 /TAXON_ID=2856 /ORGANISM="Cylindrotheca closterium" /LENGTH=64 /DNA_ID=CAMNT_0000559045 /DNA_START=176 /DNA_END=367 /DNA_ORIENTATION=- /assembly_acc=CAM_ASM_000147
MKPLPKDRVEAMGFDVSRKHESTEEMEPQPEEPPNPAPRPTTTSKPKQIAPERTMASVQDYISK